MRHAGGRPARPRPNRDEPALCHGPLDRRRGRRGAGRLSPTSEPVRSAGEAELEQLLGRDRLEALVVRAQSPQGGDLRTALRAITGEIDAAERARLDQELRAAQRIQRTLVGLTETRLGGWELACDYQPAREIGGDFLDAFPILDGEGAATRLALVIADVSGKGISAALLMAFVRPVIRAALDRTGEPAVGLERTNRILAGERQTGLFVTALCAVVELESGVVEYANAGHERPILVRGDGGEPRWIEGGGPLLGAFGQLDLEPIRVELGHGDCLLAYTDGVTDAMSPSGSRFGEARLMDVVADVRAPTPDELVARIVSAVSDFRGDTPPADDLALLAVGRPRG